MAYKITNKDRLKASWKPLFFIAAIAYVVVALNLAERDHLIGKIMLAILAGFFGLGILALFISDYRSAIRKIIQEKEQGM